MKKNIWSDVEASIVPSEKKKTSSYWFEQVFFSYQENKAVLTVPSVFVKDSFEKKFGVKVLSELKSRGFVEGYVYVVDPDMFPKKTVGKDLELRTEDPKEVALVEGGEPSPFDLSFFDRFCVGSSNKLAVVAARSIVEKPGERFNPLFLYGKPGVGKTYLLKTIEKTREDAFYIGSEEFLNSFIQGIKNKELGGFKNKIRNNKILLFDDVQFLIGKKAASEEFLNTVNHYIEEKQSIVLVSDVRPEDLSGFPERLVSRIYSGLVTDIEKPGKDVLLSYLNKKKGMASPGVENVPTVLERLLKLSRAPQRPYQKIKKSNFFCFLATWARNRPRGSSLDGFGSPRVRFRTISGRFRVRFWTIFGRFLHLPGCFLARFCSRCWWFHLLVHGFENLCYY